MSQAIINVPDNYPREKLREKIKSIEENLREEIKLYKEKDVTSKWSIFAEEIDNDPDLDNPEFQKAWKQMKNDMQEFRKDFSFKHDK